MIVDYRLEYKNDGHGTPATVVTYFVQDDKLGEDVLALDNIALALMDIEERIEEASKQKMDRIDAERTVTVAELYFRNFCDNPAYVPALHMDRLCKRGAYLMHLARRNLDCNEWTVLKNKARKTIAAYQQQYGV